MSGVNKVILVGNIGRLESKPIAGGGIVANFSVATSSKYKDKSDNWVETTEWHNVVAFGRHAEIIVQYLQKGSKVYVEGSLETSKYGEEGNWKYSTKVKLKDIQMLDKKEAGTTAPAQQQQQQLQPERKVISNFDDFPF